MENYNWHFDYVRLAWDTSFNFDKQKTLNLDKSKICLIDVDRIIDQRDFAAVERCIPTVVQYTLEGDQAAVLDENFVKVFRMGQLSVQYLLFCKKYLDNTVVLLKSELSKFKEESKELKVFNDELKDHVATLVRKLKLQKNQTASPAYKCEKCMKLFSNEQFLSAHMKRRHPNSDDDCSVNLEANKLQSEIKLLKERLNSTERLIQHEQQQPSNENAQVKDKESDARLLELQQKFEVWKVQVESELKIVQTQKNVEEKYEKWFDNVFEKLKETMEGSGKSKEVKEVDTALDMQTNNLIILRRDSVTQTETSIPVKCEELPTKNEEPANLDECKKDFDVEVLPIIKEEITKFEESVNSKVTDSFQKLETQLDSFWTKLNQIEEITKTPVHSANVVEPNVVNKDTQIEVTSLESKVTQYMPIPKENKDTQCQPKVKPRTKYQKRNTEIDHKEPDIMVEMSPKNVMSVQVITEKKYQEEVSSHEGTYDKVEPTVKVARIDSIEEGDYEIRGSVLRVQNDRKTEVLLNKRKHVTSGRKYDDIKKNLVTRRRQSSQGLSGKSSLKEGFSTTPMSRSLSNIKQRFIESSDSASGTESSSETTESDSASKILKPELTKRSPKKEIHPKQSVALTPQMKGSRIMKQQQLEQQSPEKVKTAVISVLEDRLQIIGVSPEWKSLPERSYNKAMEIVNHQAALSKKNISNYKSIRKHILQKVAKLLRKRDTSKYKKTQSTPEKSSPVNKAKETIRRTSLETSSPERASPSPKHHIVKSPKSKPKPVKMYDSHSPERSEASSIENGANQTHPKVVPARHIRGYSDVIRELKLKSSEILSSCESSLEDQDVQKKIPAQNMAVEKHVPDDKRRTYPQHGSEDVNQTKSALKNYPSVGSLTKKKVLFDLDSDSSDKPVVHHMKDGGSTTSLGSSVLDGTPRNSVEMSGESKKKFEEKEIEDLSDFDF